MRLEGKRIVVTGGAGGIGAATVRAYVREGGQVISLDVDPTSGEETAKDAGATFIKCDVSDEAGVHAAFSAAMETLGGLDVLAHLAGIERNTPAESMSSDEWEVVMRVNALGTMLTNRDACNLMRASGGGSIINAGSGGGVRGQPGSAHYAASKGAVMAWTRTAAQEWGKYGVRINCIAPAAWTPMYDLYRSSMTPDELAVHDLTMKHVVHLGGRLGDPQRDIAPVMVFLASDDSRFLTGQTISADGGMVMLGS
jgi:NAD(P)-dependent dehydrogenase (short-subunit alcohol dehydrogenase family)